MNKVSSGPIARISRGFVSRLLAIAALIVAMVVAAAVLPGLLFPVNVSERFVLYLEGLKPAGKLILLSGTERYTASKEFTTRLLVLLKIDAKVEISALAEISWFVDLRVPALWSATWDPRRKTLVLLVPAPNVLPPAVRTDTIEVRTLGGNLVSNSVFRLKREAEAMRSELSSEMERQARASLGDGSLRVRIKSSLSDLARSFCTAILGFTPETIDVRFRDQIEVARPFWGRSASNR
jgi:hypothetical protein